MSIVAPQDFLIAIEQSTDLGQHQLEELADGTFVLADHGVLTDAGTEHVRLTSEEAYRLYLCLHAHFLACQHAE